MVRRRCSTRRRGRRRRDALTPTLLLHFSASLVLAHRDDYELMPLLVFFADIINVSGHRLSTAEIENALSMHMGVAETAGAFPPLPCLAPSMLT
jgi:acyl-CoA synthetase (AMP-forming)/AMP-acid ligase II